MTQTNPHKKGFPVALGIAQTVAWGTLYYAIAVLGPPMEQELELDHVELFGLFAASLGLAGVLAPWAGRQVDRRGGRAVLTSGLLLGTLGFLILSVSHSGWTIGLGCVINGVAMAFGLYETCFAAIGQAAPESYRGVSGFAPEAKGWDDRRPQNRNRYVRQQDGPRSDTVTSSRFGISSVTQRTGTRPPSNCTPRREGDG